MQSRWARVARGASAATFATAVAAFSHVLGGGAPPSVFALVISLVFSITSCVLLTGRVLSLGRLTISVAISQALFHTLFSGMGAPVAVGHQHSPTFAVGATGLSAGHSSMWLAHAVAAAVTIMAFRHAERAFFGLATTADLVVRRVLEAASPTQIPLGRESGANVAVEELPPALSIVLSALRHRGPPSSFGTV